MQSRTVHRLVPVIAVLAFGTAASGLVWPGGPGPHEFVSVHGDVVLIDGRGLYQHDSTFVAATFRGTDAMTLVVTVPLLLVSWAIYRRGSPLGALLLAGTTATLLYVSASMTFAASFNPLFLAYAATFSACLFTLVSLLCTIDGQPLAARVSPRFPRRGMAWFLIVAGLATLGLWVSELIGPMFTGEPPANLGHYTTMFTHGFDSAVVTPACVLAGVKLLRREASGYVLGPVMLLMCVLIGVSVLAATTAQALAGIIFPVPVYIGMVGSWVAMGAIAIWFLVTFVRSLAPPPDATGSGGGSARRAANPGGRS